MPTYPDLPSLLSHYYLHASASINEFNLARPPGNSQRKAPRFPGETYTGWINESIANHASPCRYSAAAE